MASLIGDFNQQHFTDSGLPASGYRLYTFVPLTTTLKTAYTDAAGLVPHVYTPDTFGGQYIALNARGELEAPLMGDGTYDIALKRPDGSDVWTRRATAGDSIATALDTALRAELASSASQFTGAGMVANTIFVAQDRAMLKNVVSSENPAVRLIEPGRQGIFRWTSGDFSTHIAADTQEGVYIKANAALASVGAWVRVTTESDLWETDWFGVPNANPDGTGTACQTQYSAMVAAANLAKPMGIQFGSGIFSFDSKPTGLTYIATVQGVEGGTQPTILVKRYLDTAAGLLEYGTYSPRLRNLSIQAIGSGIGAGSLAISQILPSNTVNIGKPLLENVRTSMGTSNSNEVLLDGSANASGTAALRTGNLRGLECFGNLVMRGCQHWFGSECFIAGDWVVTGTVTVPSDDIDVDGVVGRNLDLGAGVDATGYVTRMTFTGNVQNDIKNRVNASRVLIVGDFGNIAERNWNVTTCRIFSQSTLQDWGSNADGLYVKYGNGDIEQWGTKATSSGAATVTFPVEFPNTVTYAAANVTTAPAANQIELAQAHTITLTTMAIRSFTLTNTPTAGTSGVTVSWYAKGA